MRKVRLVCVASVLILLAVMMLATQAIPTRDAAGATIAGAAAVQTTAATPTVSPVPVPENPADVETRWILIAAAVCGVGALGIGAWVVTAAVSKNKKRKT